MITVAYSPGYQAWQLGEGHPTNPVRALLATELLRRTRPGVELVDPSSWDLADVRAELILVHDPGYVRRVLDDGLSGEWEGARRDLAKTAGLMFAGTMELAERLAASRAAGAAPSVWFNPQGAKHHAMRMRSGGFCVFADFAAAAMRLQDAGMRVAVLDWDVHHGDGTEELLRDRPEALTVSIHEDGIFPGTGELSSLPDGAWNWPLQAGAGPRYFLRAVREALVVVKQHRPDVILLAAGADGLAGDPLSSTNYTMKSFALAAEMVGDLAWQLEADVLVGGAGGYLPHDQTPLAWATVVSHLELALEGRAEELDDLGFNPPRAELDELKAERELEPSS